MSGSIVTGFDGNRWYNRVTGSSVIANFRGTEAEAETKGRAMAEERLVDHVVLDEEGAVVSHTAYRPLARVRGSAARTAAPAQ